MCPRVQGNTLLAKRTGTTVLVEISYVSWCLEYSSCCDFLTLYSVCYMSIDCSRGLCSCTKSFSTNSYWRAGASQPSGTISSCLCRSCRNILLIFDKRLRAVIKATVRLSVRLAVLAQRCRLSRIHAGVHAAYQRVHAGSPTSSWRRSTRSFSLSTQDASSLRPARGGLGPSLRTVLMLTGERLCQNSTL